MKSQRYLSFDDRAWSLLQYMYQKGSQQMEAGKCLHVTSGSVSRLFEVSRQHARNVLERMVREGMLKRYKIDGSNSLGVVMYKPTDECDLSMRQQLGML